MFCKPRELIKPLVFVWVFSISAFAQEIQITTNPADQSGPKIYNKKIVWVDKRSGYYDIYLYDLLTREERPITTDSIMHFNPSIYEDKIVFADYDILTQEDDIYLYDLATSTQRQITSDLSSQYDPVIFGNRMAWLEKSYYCMPDGYDHSLVILDLVTQTESKIYFSASEIPDFLSLWADKSLFIIFNCYDDCLGMGGCIGYPQIWLYDIGAYSLSYLFQGYEADIYQNLIVYSNGGLYLHNLVTSGETLITDANAIFPRIFGDYVVYLVVGRLYYYQISTATSTQVPIGPVANFPPDIFGNRIVYTANRSGNLDIFMYEIPPARVEIMPDSAEVAEGNSIGFQALATWSDGSTQQVGCDAKTIWILTGDLTDGACAGNVKTIMANDIPGPDGGSGTVNAVYLGVSDAIASAVIVDNDDFLASLNVTPDSLRLLEGKAAGFQALAMWTDGFTRQVACDSETTWTVAGDLREVGCVFGIETIQADEIPGPAGGSGTVSAAYLGLPDLTPSLLTVDNDDAPTGTLRTLPADSHQNFLGCGQISQTSSPLSLALLTLLALGIGLRLTRPD